RFSLSSALSMNASGVILEGTSSAANGSILHSCSRSLTISIDSNTGPIQSSAAGIIDKVVPAGARSLRIRKTAADGNFRVNQGRVALNPGDNVLVTRDGNQSWITAIQMDVDAFNKMCLVNPPDCPNAPNEAWHPFQLNHERRITRVETDGANAYRVFI